jgi:myo-inositol-1(or 4)-monophosphatase
MPPTLEELQDLARQAGAILRAGYGKAHQIGHKGVTDLVTEMDHRAEDAIIAAIRRRYPQHSLVTEESGSLAGDAENCWYVDPLDGTVNYAHHIPIFCVSLAYASHNSVLLGVIYDPMREELFSAERGKGATLNGEPIHVSDSETLIDSLLVTGFPYDLWKTPRNNLDHFSAFSQRSQGVRRLGSAALDLAYIAAGRFDGYWEISLKSWDVAAGMLIAREAGATATRLNGDPNFLTPPVSVLAANPNIYPTMLAALKDA